MQRVYTVRNCLNSRVKAQVHLHLQLPFVCQDGPRGEREGGGEAERESGGREGGREGERGREEGREREGGSSLLHETL